MRPFVRVLQLRVYLTHLRHTPSCECSSYHVKLRTNFPRQSDKRKARSCAHRIDNCLWCRQPLRLRQHKQRDNDSHDRLRNTRPLLCLNLPFASVPSLSWQMILAKQNQNRITQQKEDVFAFVFAYRSTKEQQRDIGREILRDGCVRQRVISF